MFEVSPTISVSQAAKLLGVSRSTLYRAAAADTAPVPVLKIGSRIVVPTKPLLDLIGLDKLPTDDEPKAA